MRSDEPASRLATNDRLSFRLGRRKRLLLRGRIDRINRLVDGTYEIVDYKTGVFWRDDWVGVFAGGTRLQHALYGRRRSELLRGPRQETRTDRARVVRVSDRARVAKPRRLPAATRAQTGSRVLGDLCDVIASGAFIHAPEKSGCKWCDFGAACGARAD